MQKKYYVVVIILIIFVIITLVGIKNNFYRANGQLICTYKSKNIDSKFNTVYQVTYKNRYVTKVETIEKIEASDANLLLSYKTSLDDIYNKYNKVKYYSNESEIIKNTLTSKTTINYEKINTKDLIKINPSLKEIIVNGKINIDKIRKKYIESGAKCSYRK